jgi:hypothetical protein
MNARSHLTSNAASVLELFRLGWGTDRIAEYWNITEANALRRLNVERSIAKGLSVEFRRSPYIGTPVKDWLAGLHPGIGRSGL